METSKMDELGDKMMNNSTKSPDATHTVPFPTSKTLQRYCFVTQADYDAWFAEVRKGWPTTNTGSETLGTQVFYSTD